jgi:hypothetical protein
VTEEIPPEEVKATLVQEEKPAPQEEEVSKETF